MLNARLTFKTAVAAWACLCAAANAATGARIEQAIVLTPDAVVGAAAALRWASLCAGENAAPKVLHASRNRWLLVQHCAAGLRFFARVNLKPEPRLAWVVEAPKPAEIKIDGFNFGRDFLQLEGAGQGGVVLRSQVLGRFALVNEDGHFQWIQSLPAFSFKTNEPVPVSGVSTTNGTDIFRIESRSTDIVRLSVKDGVRQVIGQLPGAVFGQPHAYELRLIDSNSRYLVVLSQLSNRVSPESRGAIVDTENGRIVFKKSYVATAPAPASFLVDAQGCLHIRTYLDSGQWIDELVSPCPAAP